MEKMEVNYRKDLKKYLKHKHQNCFTRYEKNTSFPCRIKCFRGKRESELVCWGKTWQDVAIAYSSGLRFQQGNGEVNPIAPTEKEKKE